MCSGARGRREQETEDCEQVGQRTTSADNGIAQCQGRTDDAMQAGRCAPVGMNILPLLHHDSASACTAGRLLILQSSAQTARSPKIVGARVHRSGHRRGAGAPQTGQLHDPEQRRRSPRSLRSKKAAAAQPPCLLVPELANIPRVVRKQVNYLQPDHLPK